jgi:O-antigen ligase
LAAAAAAAAAPLGMGLYISFSRGALFACAAGLVALLVAAPRREQLEGVALTVAAGALAAGAAAPFKGVTSLAGSLGTREHEGTLVVVLVALVAVAAAGVRWRLRARGTLRLPRRAPWIATAAICAGLALAIVLGAKEGRTQVLSGGASRLTTLQSNRYDYWDVALRAFSSEPVHGVGAGGWSVWWLRYRTINDFAQDAHSLPLQTLAELGVVGIVLLAAFFAGIGVAAAEAHGVAPAAAAGPIAGFIAYAAHVPLDWDWQMPAVTIVALILAGELIALAQLSRRARAPAPTGGPGGP